MQHCLKALLVLIAAATTAVSVAVYRRNESIINLNCAEVKMVSISQNGDSKLAVVAFLQFSAVVSDGLE